jgi:archaemetzincin
MKAGILIVPVGEVEVVVLEHICSTVQEAFGRECRLGEVLPKPDNAFNRRRGQYFAQEILQRLRMDGAERVLGVVGLDLYLPRLNFIFGLADPFGGRAVIAIPRLHQEFYGLPEDRELFLHRVMKEAVHELGHTFGLGHCHNRHCVMAFSNSLADTDYKGQAFCRKCLSKLYR